MLVMKVAGLLVSLGAICALGCQDYAFVFQPKTDRVESVLRFFVETPSKADILFVVDNSKSMGQEQAALASGMGQMLDVLAKADTDYRIGLVSTDAHGFQVDCCGEQLPSVSIGESVSVLGAKGNCQRCGCDGECGSCPECVMEVELSRPNDGARGRLIAAYDPQAFQREKHSDLTVAQWNTLNSLLPTTSLEMPAVIDREAIAKTVCNACGCTSCEERQECSEQEQSCIEAVSKSMVTALFESNLAGLGISGFGWEEGLKSALLAVGVEAEETTDELALAPATSLLLDGAPNSLEKTDGSWEPWIRDDALLALMVVSDEDDCSMPQFLMDIRHTFEEGSFPEGSICYQSEARESFLDVERMGSLLLAKKGGAASRLAYGVIGGIRPSGQSGAEWRAGEASDCASLPSGESTFGCSCLEGAAPEDFNGWCALTQDTSGEGPVCSGMAASRYLAFGSVFQRTSYESICEKSPNSRFGAALQRFAKMATLACFDLDGIEPAGAADESIQVSRIDRDDSQKTLVLLPQTNESSLSEGWYYVATENKICLSQLNRRLGDYYEIRVTHTDEVLYNQ